MTLDDIFQASYLWADAHALGVFGTALAVPVAGTALSYIGKGGRTDEDGRAIASAVLVAGVIAAVVGILAVGIGVGVYGQSVLKANVLLVLAPLLCVFGSFAGVRLVFPLSELATVRTLADLAVFFGAVGAVLWALSTFRGWGIIFFGSFTQLIAVVALTGFLLWRLYRRAFKLSAST